MAHIFLGILFLSGLSNATILTFAVPPTLPSGSASYTRAAIAVSLEFSAFPSYFLELNIPTNQCLQNLETLSGRWPSIRIGGASQDRAAYNATSTAYITPTVPKHTGAAATLQFGPYFMSLADSYSGDVVLGLNRGLANLSNTISAAKAATSLMTNLKAIELGNEPDLYQREKEPIVTGPWTPKVDAKSENDWDVSVGQAISKTNIIQAGVFAYEPSLWGAAELIRAENSTVRSYVYSYSHHNYPGGTLENLMSHGNIVRNVAEHESSAEAARSAGKPYVLGETNSVAGGGSPTVSPTFGAALWTMDYSLRAVYTNISQTYFHQGKTLGPCYYCWWSLSDIRNPYYGAYAASAALAGGSYLTALDTGTDNYAVYVIYDASSKALHALIYNSEYYSGHGTRNVATVALTGLVASGVTAKRLTAASALSMRSHGHGSIPSFGGQSFEDGTCQITGTEILEHTAVSKGIAVFEVAASEALLIYLT